MLAYSSASLRGESLFAEIYDSTSSASANGNYKNSSRYCMIFV